MLSIHFHDGNSITITNNNTQHTLMATSSNGVQEEYTHIESLLRDLCDNGLFLKVSSVTTSLLKTAKTKTGKRNATEGIEEQIRFSMSKRHKV
jgi:hypothetical protein